MVRDAVKALIGEWVSSLSGDLDTIDPRSSSSKAAFNVNADEAAVLGAAFYGASLSRQFRTKEIKVEDLFAHDVQVSYAAESKIATRIINTSIFPAGSKHGARKTLTFKRKDDFNVTLVYKNAETK
jgi:hypoxia up-regulated 1